MPGAVTILECAAAGRALEAIPLLRLTRIDAADLAVHVGQRSTAPWTGHRGRRARWFDRHIPLMEPCFHARSGSRRALEQFFRRPAAGLDGRLWRLSFQYPPDCLDERIDRERLQDYRTRAGRARA